MKELEVLNFINSNENWEEVLSSSPYNIIIKKKEPFLLLKYNQVEPKSDMSNRMVQECRGLILKNESGYYKVASMRFNKFFNYGQEEAAVLKFPCIASEKIDGSLIGVWYDDDSGWHVSTSGNIDAEDANMVNVNGLSNFRDLFNIAWKNSYFDNMDKNLTYMFELVSPYNKLVVPYSKTKLYLLAIRNNITLEEFKIEDVVSRGKATFDDDILYPKYFVCNNINEVKQKADALKDDSENWEGFVNNIQYMKDYIAKFVANKNPDLGIKCIASQKVDSDQLQSEEAQLFGCDPDFNAYTQMENPKPKGNTTNLRSAGQRY